MQEDFFLRATDLDGTLLNTLADLHNITNKTLEEFGYPLRSMEEIERFVGNDAAIRLYEKLGFRLAGRRKNFYRDPVEDAYIYTILFKEEIT